MKLFRNNYVYLAVASAFTAVLANAGTVSFTCAPNVDAAVGGTCNTLNTTIAGLYSSTFSNANADIYIQYGTTGLGSSTTGYDNQISYTQYVNALIAENGPGSVRAGAIASLPATEPALYGGAPIDISSALGEALGITNLNGTTAGGALCTIGIAGCYNGIITITNDPSTLLYYRNGAQDPTSYDFYTTVEHEVDEVLGTSSCVGTTATLTNGCPNSAAAAVDLYRFNGGNRVLVDPTPGAYFSYDGGATNGAGGALYNTLANGDDYADFLSGCPTVQHVQDGTGCPGLDGGLDITNDGGAEINILDAVGYNLNPAVTTVPEPSAVTLFVAPLWFSPRTGSAGIRIKSALAIVPSPTSDSGLDGRRCPSRDHRPLIHSPPDQMTGVLALQPHRDSRNKTKANRMESWASATLAFELNTLGLTVTMKCTTHRRMTGCCSV